MHIVSYISLLNNRTKTKMKFYECHYFGKPLDVVGNLKNDIQYE
jgi:hypothetical protein